MTAAELAALGAADLAMDLQRGAVSTVEVMAAVLGEIERREPELRAWAEIDTAGARRAARAADARHRANLPLGPLHGVPFGVKDIFDVAGLPTRAGFAPYETRVAQEDSACVARLRAAGAIPIGKTVTTQFALADPPPTRNPWHAGRTPGGSSSGSAAAVGGRTLPLALGSQTAGSVLRPAAYCGAVGFKPTWGRYSLAGVLPLAWSLDHPGLIARSAADCDLVDAVLAGGDPAAGPAAAPRLLLLAEFLERSVPAMREHIEAVAARLAEAGATVERGDIPARFDLLLALQTVIMGAEAAAAHAHLLAQHRDAYGPRLRLFVEVGHLTPTYAYLHADRLRARLIDAVDAFMVATGADALLLPTASAVAPTPETTGDRSFQAPWSLLGMPAISLPTGFDADRLPYGTQLVGRRGQDRHLLAVARWAESALAG